jgi:hypothetical protein
MRRTLLLLVLCQGAAWGAPPAKPDKIVPLHKATVYPDSVALSPDGTTLAFAAVEGKRPKAKVSLVVVDLRSLGAKTFPLPGSPTLLQFAGADRTLWFVVEKDIYRFALADKAAKKWRTLSTEIEGLLVSPKEQVYATLKVLIPGRGRNAGPLELQKVCAVAEQGEPRPLTRDYVGDGRPIFGAAGNLILDARYPNKQGALEEREIALLTLKGKRTRLTRLRGNCYSPGASGDGKLVAFGCTQGKGENTWERLQLLNLKTKKLTTVIDDKGISAYGPACFSPDASLIAVAANKEAWTGFLVPSGGGAPLPIASLPETSVVGFALGGKAVILESKQHLYLATWK